MAIQIEAYEEASRSGWVPHLAAVQGDETNAATRGNKYLRLTGYVGGVGTVPSDNVGNYIGPDGYVEVQEQATDISRYDGDEVARYLRDIGFSVELPLVTLADVNQGAVLGASGASDTGYGWGRKVTYIDQLLWNTRNEAVDRRQYDSKLLPSPLGVLLNNDRNNIKPVAFAIWEPNHDVPVADREAPGTHFPRVGHWRTVDFEQKVRDQLRLFSDDDFASNRGSGSGDNYVWNVGHVLAINSSGRLAISPVTASTINGYTIEVVDSLPSNPDDNTIYLIRAGS